MTRRDEKWKLPKSLQLTPERLLEVDAEQRRLAARAQSPFASLSPREHERARALRLIEELKAEIGPIEKRLGKVFTAAGATDFDELTEAQHDIWRRLAEAHAAVGRYDLAAHYETDRNQKAFYLRVWRAVHRDDSHWCGCPAPLNGGTHTFAKTDVWSVKHGRVMPLLKCSNCNCLNVAALPKELAEQRAHRQSARRIASGMSLEDAANALRARRHTTKELIK